MHTHPLSFERQSHHFRRTSAVDAVTSRVVPSALVPSEAAAESSFFGQEPPPFWQVAQSAHSGFVASSLLSHVPTGQQASHEPPPDPDPDPDTGGGEGGRVVSDGPGATFTTTFCPLRQWVPTSQANRSVPSLVTLAS